MNSILPHELNPKVVRCSRTCHSICLFSIWIILKATDTEEALKTEKLLFHKGEIYIYRVNVHLYVVPFCTEEKKNSRNRKRTLSMDEMLMHNKPYPCLLCFQPPPDWFLT